MSGDTSAPSPPPGEPAPWSGIGFLALRSVDHREGAMPDLLIQVSTIVAVRGAEGGRKGRRTRIQVTGAEHPIEVHESVSDVQRLLDGLGVRLMMVPRTSGRS